MAGSHSVRDLRQLVILHPQSHTQFKTQNQGMGVTHGGLGLPTPINVIKEEPFPGNSKLCQDDN